MDTKYVIPKMEIVKNAAQVLKDSEYALNEWEPIPSNVRKLITDLRGAINDLLAIV